MDNPATDWATIITVVVAAYGALLSTYLGYLKHKENKREVNVKLSFGLLPSYSSMTYLFISASNSGKRPVTLNSVGLILPNDMRIFITPTSKTTNAEFPHKLIEGECCDVWPEIKGIANDIKKEGFTGKIKLRGYFRDALGKVYKSKPLNFDVDDWIKNAP